MPIQIQILLGAMILVAALHFRPERLPRYPWSFVAIVMGTLMLADLIYNSLAR